MNAAADAAGPGNIVPPGKAVPLLSRLLKPGDRVVLEGNNQKQARFLSQALVGLDPAVIHDLHLLMSCVALPEHLEVFSRGIATRLDFAFSGPQAVPLARQVAGGTVSVGAIHTYVELYSRYFTDLTPHVALVAAECADEQGNLYTGANTEETPVICEATHAGHGIVIAEVERVVRRLPRVDVPADQVEYVIPTGTANTIDPLFTRDPAHITDDQVLMGMMIIKGIYAEYGVQCLNHGIGYATAAVELLLPTYGGELGLRGRVASHWALNPHPTLIPAIEAGFVTSVHSFGSEPGMEKYIAARQNVFFTCHEGVLKSNRLLCHAVGYYDIDCFVGSTLQIDADGNSSTAVKGRISGFGGAPNLGSNAGGRRHSSPAWLRAGRETADASGHPGLPRGRKLIVQVTPTVSAARHIPVFVDTLDAVEMAKAGQFDLPPVMIYAEDVTHIVTERGIACLLRCAGREERRAAIRAVAGETGVGQREVPSETRTLRTRGIVRLPSDLDIDPASATRQRLAAECLDDLVGMSGGLYRPPPQLTGRS